MRKKKKKRGRYKGACTTLRKRVGSAEEGKNRGEEKEGSVEEG